MFVYIDTETMDTGGSDLTGAVQSEPAVQLSGGYASG